MITLESGLAMLAEDCPELASEVEHILRFRRAHLVHVAQQAEADRQAATVQQFNQSTTKTYRIGYT